ncbi:uncharacterized protein LOC124166557 isoform X2 [Ischnura elegans]|nr:uncharacterized protein LOC124166557 isoform X2 [Ischnura elegans]XP_046400076.1 uncharacterized protein LOC124166557 isoform X2 [Ischnura elegans]
MVEANKTKLAATAASRNSHSTNNHVIQSGQTSIQNFLTKQATPANKDVSKKPAENVEKETPIDEESAKGRFGWETFGKCYVPYVFRRGVKYVAVRMVEMKLLNKFLAHVHPDLYSCTCIRSYFITEAEARLLNEINIRHSEGQFGKENFTCKDSVVLLQDAIEFYNFLEVTYSKLLLHKNDPKDKCGFIRINGEAVVPFTVRDGEKYVPLFYFEGETDNLKLKAKQLEGWDLSYLKFCCKVQGIRNELFASDTCSVISLNDIKSYFPASTQFQDYWPSKVINPLILDNVSTGAQQGAWTKQPGGAPATIVKTSVSSSLPSHHISKSIISSDNQMKMLQTNSHVPTPSLHQPQIPPTTTIHSSARMNVCQTSTSSAAAINGWSGLVGGQPTYQTTNQTMRLASTGIPGLNPVSTASSRQYPSTRARPGQPYYAQVPMTGSATLPPTQSTLSSTVASHPPPLIRGTAAPSNLVSPHRSQQHAQMQSQHHTQRLQQQAHQLQPQPQAPQVQRQPQHQPQHHQQRQPQQTQHHQQRQQQQQQQQQHQQQQQQQQHQQQQHHQLQQQRQQEIHSRVQQQNNQVLGNVRGGSTSVHAGGGSNGDLSRHDPAAYKLIQIQETQVTGQHMPYKVSKAYVEGQLVPCINAKPYIYSELLMTLPDLASHFFSSVSWHTLRQVLQDVLGVSLFRGNRLHMQVLRSSGKCQSSSDIVPLVQVRDVMQYMPQLRYMFGRINNDESLSKRQRTS